MRIINTYRAVRFGQSGKNSLPVVKTDNETNQTDSFVAKHKVEIGLASAGLLVATGLVLKKKFSLSKGQELLPSNSKSEETARQSIDNAKRHFAKESQKLHIEDLEKVTGSLDALVTVKDDPVRYLLAQKGSKLLPEFQNMFEQVKGLKGEEFIRKSYDLMVKHLGYEGCAPSIKVVDEDSRNFAVFNSVKGVIELNRKNLNSESASHSIGTIWHEFTHFIQTSDIIRTESIGHKGFLEANAKSVLVSAMEDPKLSNTFFGKVYDRLTEEDRLNFINSYVERKRLEINIDLYADVISKKGFIKPLDSRSLDSEQYLNAISEYPSETVNEKDIEKYRANLIEIEADIIGRKVASMYQEFLNRQK